MNNQAYRLKSLTEGNWFKLICGASYQHLPAIRSLALAYSLAGADCIDVAADKAVISAAQEGISVAAKLSDTQQQEGSIKSKQPLLMVSLNDDEDPHFRKAEFESIQCPADCPRPCVKICPAQAINDFGVIDSLCYGCGRCLPICPENLILTRSYVSTPQTVIPWIEEMGIDAIEIHTQAGHFEQFHRLWQTIYPVVKQLKVLAISCSDAPDVIQYMRSLYALIAPLPCPLIWQTDGRPMSGDIGAGTTHAAVKFAKKIIGANLPGYVQLAGGTNGYTITKLKSAGMLKKPQNKINSDGINNKKVSGVAYGSYARSLILPTLEQLEMLGHEVNSPTKILENNPQLLQQAVKQAHSLVTQIKTQVPQTISR
ncbi:4Fe-4S ferredoxin iron-sulfur binding domain protein [Hyella patelloides LEGE 07179]|uniref:4Fe-4S ferredoxin iron-sulfur binding domain protein n=1 Tax=Hyella patelloides LEGE 07179 TaxID=945734 RepID=A0A563VXJ1_9CYAN|nr:LdpA C-terminal domain-containing domain [Hyella patelloides]VEP16141.1 4Fe-4S ferredoxin iron-sulfur binding domain protein [Hyella patelloides LEGE 07179]